MLCFNKDCSISINCGLVAGFLKKKKEKEMHVKGGPMSVGLDGRKIC